MINMYFIKKQFLMKTTLLTSNKSSLNDYQLKVLDGIKEMDLGPVRFKLNYEYNWDMEKIDVVEKQYKLFLWATVALNLSIPPNKAIDEFWHNHILDTALYLYHCETVFGKFIHHFPYFGVRSKQDANDLLNSFQKTLEVFEKYSQLFDADPLNNIVASECVGQCAEHGCNTCKSITAECDSPVYNEAFHCAGGQQCNPTDSLNLSKLELYAVRPTI